jgi:hypothetical protein
MLTAIQSAEMLINGNIEDKYSLWDINTEQEYSEEKRQEANFKSKE